jgi:hypothetical protein
MGDPGYLVLDIETVPDGALWTPPEPSPGSERVERAWPPLYASQVVVVGTLWLDSALACRRLAVVGTGGGEGAGGGAGAEKDEAATLAELSAFMQAERPHLVTWNGRGFDLPVLLLRALHHGIPFPWYYQEREYRYRYSGEGHLDLGDFLADHGAARMTSLDGVARAIGLPGKDGMDGSQVEGLYLAGEMETLRQYCLSDVVQTAFVFLRARLLAGQLDRDGYRRAATALLAAVEADGRLARLVGGIDRDRLLLR